MPKTSDFQTLQFYEIEAEEYARRSKVKPVAELDTFTSRLPAGGAVLELGCGAGYDSRVLIDRGFEVTPTDGSAAMAVIAADNLGIPVRVMRFEALDAVGAYDGVWTSACLLHVPRIGLPKIFGKINAALKPGGVFYASFKTGEAEGVDAFGRYYNYPDEAYLRALFARDGWSGLEIEERAGGGYFNMPARWLHVFAVKC